MAKFFYGLNQSLDGYVDHDNPAFGAPGPELFRHYIDRMRQVAGSLYGRRVYELMTYWQQDNPDWPEDQRAFAQAWRETPKWVVSRTLNSVGPNATLVNRDIEAALRRLKADVSGEIEVAGPTIAQSLTDWGLIDEYQLYLRPYVLGRGTPFFARPRPPLRLVANELVGEDTIRLTYVPA
jgi:dihydrofolate reductase